MKKLIAILGIGFAGFCLADQVQHILTTRLDISITFNVDGSSSTNYLYTVSVPNPFGTLPDQQLQSSVSYSGSKPDLTSLTNNLLATGVSLLNSVGASTNNVTLANVPQ